MNSLFTRRRFLRTSFLGGAAAWTIPAFLDRTFFALDAQAAVAGAGAPTGRDHRILVLLQLAGGNDGLNTLVPHGEDAYYAARPKLAIATDKCLKLGDRFGLHPAMAALRGLFDDGRAAAVLGVGYPNPNRSHFRSTDIWQTASDADKVERRGWVGRYFDACCAGEDPGLGVAIGRQEPLAFVADSPRSIALADASGLDASALPDAEAMSAIMAEEEAGGTVGALPGQGAASGAPADFLRRVAMDARLSSDRIRDVIARFRTSTAFPKTALGQSLGLIARLIAGSMPTRVYYASHGGYDTHGNQAGTHARLLGELSEAVAAFDAEMRAQGNGERVLLMTFSEFGRRVAENGSGGTDHGAAAPLFAVGGDVAAGLHGRAPSLEKLERGDLVHTVDFRSVYATVLERWLQVPSQPVLQRSFPKVPFLA